MSLDLKKTLLYMHMHCPGHQPPEDMHEQNLEEILKN
jgi:hypothetical protein